MTYSTTLIEHSAEANLGGFKEGWGGLWGLKNPFIFGLLLGNMLMGQSQDFFEGGFPTAVLSHYFSNMHACMQLFLCICNFNVLSINFEVFKLQNLTASACMGVTPPTQILLKTISHNS